MENQKFIEGELERNPHFFDNPWCDEFIDRQTLAHVVANTDCPEGVDFDTFRKSLNAVCEVLAIFPYLKIPSVGRPIRRPAGSVVKEAEHGC